MASPFRLRRTRHDARPSRETMCAGSRRSASSYARGGFDVPVATSAPAFAERVAAVSGCRTTGRGAGFRGLDPRRRSCHRRRSSRNRSWSLGTSASMAGVDAAAMLKISGSAVGSGPGSDRDSELARCHRNTLALIDAAATDRLPVFVRSRIGRRTIHQATSVPPYRNRRKGPWKNNVGTTPFSNTNVR